MIWITLSCVAALLWAVWNIWLAWISKYQYRAAFLTGPGNLICNISLLSIVSFNDRSKWRSPDISTPSTMENLSATHSDSYFNWFYDLYYTTVERSDRIVSIPNYERILATFLIILVSFSIYFALVEAYYFSLLADLNSGVMTSIFSLKSVLSSISFFVFYGQKLYCFELIAIALLITSVVIIGISIYREDQDEFSSSFQYAILSILFLIWFVILKVAKSTIAKYFFDYKSQKGNVSAFYSFSGMICDFIFIWTFVIDILIAGFRYTLFDMLIAFIQGILYAPCNYIWAYVNIRGKAGPSDAIIQTAIIYQTFLDAIIFGRKPNILQYTSIVIVFVALAIIFKGHYQIQHKQKSIKSNNSI